GQPEAELTGSLIERGFGDELAKHLLIEPECARLIRRNRSPDLAAKLLQAFVVELAELLDADLGPADLGETGAAKTAENIANAPDREAHDQEAHDDGHHGFAEPIGGGFADTSKHRWRLNVGIAPTGVSPPAKRYHHKDANASSQLWGKMCPNR